MGTFKPTLLVVDLVVTVDWEDVLLIRRGIPPHMDKLVFPGGHVDAEDPEHEIKADESVPHAAARELKEETGLIVDPKDLTFLTFFDAPIRDERKDARRISAALTVNLKKADIAGARADSDAKELIIRSLASIRQKELGFDHWKAIPLLRHRIEMSRAFWNEQNEYGLPKHTCPAMTDNDWSDDIEIIYSFEAGGAFIECTESGSADFSERINLCPACGIRCPKPKIS